MNERTLQLPDKQMVATVVDRCGLPSDWPTHKGSREFWEEPGRTVASFDFLEDTLARAYFAVTGSREYKQDEVDAVFIRKWIQSLEVSLYATLSGLTKRICKALTDDDRIPPEVGTSIVARLRALSVWRNALCHGAWTHFDAEGSARLRFFRKANDGAEIEMLDNRLSKEEIARKIADVVELTTSLIEVTGSLVVPFPGSASSEDDSVPAQGGNGT